MSCIKGSNPFVSARIKRPMESLHGAFFFGVLTFFLHHLAP